MWQSFCILVSIIRIVIYGKNIYNGIKVTGGNLVKVLVVIDMQNDFINMALGTKEALAIVPNVKNRINQSVMNGDLIVFTRDTHDNHYMETQEGVNLPVPHCIKGSIGWQISQELNTDGAIIIDKPTFGTLKLAEVIKEGTGGKIDEITLIGLCTDICVISNAMILKAQFPEVKLLVDASLCAGVTKESHNNAINAMKMCQITIMNS